uniref:Uncharacterized protein n=1 Tax=Arundo donax TaxID=35708 RepID=A0A0A8Z6E6_ARUDO
MGAVGLRKDCNGMGCLTMASVLFAVKIWSL